MNKKSSSIKYVYSRTKLVEQLDALLGNLCALNTHQMSPDEVTQELEEIMDLVDALRSDLLCKDK